jgi:hypothetical protein
LTTKDGPEANFVIIKEQLWSEIPFSTQIAPSGGQK